MDKANKIKPRENKSSKYSLSFKRQVVDEYLSTGVGKRNFQFLCQFETHHY